MVKFKGRYSLKQYQPLKPIKRGVKIWERCDSRTGYVYDFNIYSGKEEKSSDGSENRQKLNQIIFVLISNNRYFVLVPV
jgi:hypothetical protein